MLTLASLFDGISGFPLAGARHRIEPVWASEIEPFPTRVSAWRFPEMKQHGDITKINGAETEPADVITFGSPCQDLSVAGKRAGMKHSEFGDEETTRSGLFMDAVRIIREMREETLGLYPRYAVWENVPGAFSSNGGEDFYAVIEELCKTADETVIIPRPTKGKWPTAGAVMGDHFSLAWRVLDAQYHGVAQRRRRVFLIVDFTGQSAHKILLKPESMRGHTSPGGDAREEAAEGAERGTPKTMLIRCGCDGGGKGPLIQENKSATLSCNNNQTLFEPKVYIVENHPADSRVDIDESGKVQTLTSRMGTGGGNVPMVIQEAYSIETYHAQNFKECASTLKARDWKDPQCVSIDYAIRRLTPLECERLQGFPDGWTDIEGAVDTARYKALGNSVAIPCVEFVIGRISEQIREERTKCKNSWGYLTGIPATSKKP